MLTDSPSAPDRFEVLTAQQIRDWPEPSPAYQLLGPLVERDSRVMLVGATGHGKTTLALQMVAAIVEGREFLGLRGAGDCRALIVDLEQRQRVIRERVAELDLAAEDSVGFALFPDGINDDQQLDWIEQTAAGYDVVVIDPFYRLHPGRDANREQEMEEVLRRLDRWKREGEFALILPIHSRKQPPGYSYRRPTVDDIFGSAVISRNADLVLSIHKTGSGSARLAQHPEGMSYVQIMKATGYSSKSVRDAVKTLNCVATEEKSKTKYWSLQAV